MFRTRQFPTRGLWIVCGIVFLVFALESPGQETDKPVLRQGEVTGDDVYVRSGASVNHYPVCKLNAGERVTVVGEKGEWYEILPPEDTFSLISGDYVDAPDNKKGVVSGNKVRVRAGSSLPQFGKQKYVVQTKLPKGAEVTILGREADGFLRIKPPVGVTLWINRNFIEFVPEELIGLEAEAKATPGSDAAAEKPATAETDESPDDAPKTGVKEVPPSTFAAMPPTPQRRQLSEIDTAVTAELARPVLERRFEPLVERYRAIARQEDDDFARSYATARIERLREMTALIDTVRKMRKLNEQAESRRREFLEGRAAIRDVMPPPPSGLDAQGELRLSALYPPEAFPRRYRLVDTSGAYVRTIGYVEIPPDSAIDVEAFIGSYVGVRASAKRLQAGGVNPVPIYVASELILLQPTTPGATDSARRD